MNLLIIDWALPSSPFSGKTVRLKNIYGRLAKRNKVVYLRTAPNGLEKESPELAVWAQEVFYHCERLPMPTEGRSLSWLAKALIKRLPWFDFISKYPKQTDEIKATLIAIAKRFEIDLVVTFSIESAVCGSLLASEMPWVQDLGDSMELQLKRRMGNAGARERSALLLRLWREACFERRMVERANKTIFVAEDDACLYSKTKKTAVIPNGVDADYFNPENVKGVAGHDPYFVFTGHMNFPPNVDAAVYFAEEIFPRVREENPKVQFVIAGADPTERVKALEIEPGIRVTGAVADLRPFLCGAKAFVCPMRMGSGIKNKILEAMVMQLPIVASPLACAGIEGLPSGVAQIDRPEAFAEQVLNILRNYDRFKREAMDFRAWVSQRYSWASVVSAYEHLFQKEVEGKPAGITAGR